MLLRAELLGYSMGLVRHTSDQEIWLHQNCLTDRRRHIDPSHTQPLRFRPAKAPTRDELTQLTHTITHRVGRYEDY